MDRTQASLSWDPNQDDAVWTRYSNPKYGVDLKLPGKWEFSPIATRYLCYLKGQAGFTAIMAIYFEWTPSIEADSAQTADRITKQGWTLESQESTEVSQLPARILRLAANRGVRVDVLMSKRWPLDYTLEIVGPRDNTTVWKSVDAGLGQSVQIK